VTLHLQGSLLGNLITWQGFLAVFLGRQADAPAAEAEALFNEGHGYTTGEPGNTLRRPRLGELQLLEGCLRALPGFIERHDMNELASEEVSVPAAGGEIRMTLSWVTEGEREL